MKRFMSVVLAASVFGYCGATAPACPVATSTVAIESGLVQTVPAPVVVQSVPVVATLVVPTVSVVAVPPVIEQVVKVKAKRHFRTPVRSLLFR